MTYKVLISVVTYNRINLLKRCIRSIEKQTYKFEKLLIVNNGSTDGTLNFLKSNNIDFIQNEKTGSAKGWYSSLKYGFENNYDFVWLMDDDGYPDNKALEVLINKINLKKHACISSIVINENDHSKLVFPVPTTDHLQRPIFQFINSKLSTINECISKSKNDLVPFAHLFNGALINMKLASQIKNINLNLYHHGVELDYYYRLAKIGSMLTCCKALHFHPDINKRKINNFWIYNYVKNSILINKKYLNYSFLRNIKVILVTLYRIYTRNGLTFFIFKFLFNKSFFLYILAISKGFFSKI